METIVDLYNISNILVKDFRAFGTRLEGYDVFDSQFEVAIEFVDLGGIRPVDMGELFLETSSIRGCRGCLMELLEFLSGFALNVSGAKVCLEFRTEVGEVLK